jgi:hypothetical protein
MKKIELSDQKLQYEKMIEDIKRENEKNQQINATQYENELKRIKK